MTNGTDHVTPDRLLLRAGAEERPDPDLLERTLDRARRADHEQRASVGSLHRRGPLLSRSVLVPLGIAAGLALAVAVAVTARPGPQAMTATAEPEVEALPPSITRTRAPDSPSPSLSSPSPHSSAPAPRLRAAPKRAPARDVADVTSATPITADSAAPPVVEPDPAELVARNRIIRDRQEQQAAAARAAATTCVPSRCEPVRPSDPLVTDFEDLSPSGVFVDNDKYSAPNPDWWRGFYGSTYVYPMSTYALSQTTDGTWRIRGTVSDWSGFGLWLGACVVDWSAYRGLSFYWWGNAGPSGTVTLHVDTDEDSVAERCRTNVGRCDPDAGPCKSPAKRMRVPARRAGPVVVLWNEFTGGHPRPTPDPARIIQLHWTFDWKTSNAAKETYVVDVSLDDIRLVR